MTGSDETPGEKVRRAMAGKVSLGAAPAAKSVADRGMTGGPSRKPHRGRKSPPQEQISEPPAAAAIDHLTPFEWATLEQCAQLDENDADNGKRLLMWFGDRILHVVESGWYSWTGTHWDLEVGKHAVERYAHLVVPMIKREAALLSATSEELAAMAAAESVKKAQPDPKTRTESDKDAIKFGADIAKALAGRRHGRYQFGVRSGDRPRTRAMIEQAEPHRTVLPGLMDADDLSLNLSNGTLRFSRQIDPDCPDPGVRRYTVTKQLRQHDPADCITKIAAAAYRPGAVATRFLGDLERFMPDPQTREFLQVFLGYTALGLTGEQVYAFLYGDGQNWKSAFLQAVARTLGTYAKPMNFASVTGTSTPSGDKASPDWARLPGVRMLTIEEVPRREPIREELIKMITSGSDMPVRHLNKGLFDMAPKFTCLMTSNAEPNISGADQGIWRRTLIVRWDVVVPEAERLPFDQVMAIYEAEREGILAWLVEGIEKYLANGLKPYVTDDMRGEIASLRRDRDAIGAFGEDCLVSSPGHHPPISSSVLYRAFVRWCGANGVDPVPSQTAFGTKIKRVPIGGTTMGKLKVNRSGTKYFVDIGLHNVPSEVSLEPDL